MSKIKLVALLIVLMAAVAIGPILFGQRSLDEADRVMAFEIFGDGLNYDAVRLREGGLLTRIYPALTTGNVISFPSSDRAPGESRRRALLIHELAHVWQYQHCGVSYLPRAIYEEITQRDAYVVHYDENKSLGDYDIEEQAEIATEYYLRQTGEYAGYIAEFKNGFYKNDQP